MPRITKTVMVVVHEPFVRDLIATNLRSAGCFPLPVSTMGEGKRIAAQVVPDAMVLDIDDLTEEDNCWALELSRTCGSGFVRTAMLSSRRDIECGADNGICGAHLCVDKPFETREFIGQLLRLLRQGRGDAAAPRMPPLRYGPIELARESPTAKVRNADGWRTVHLAWTEHRLLQFFLSEPERVRTREAILAAVWPDAPVDARTVDQYVRRLRRSLAAANASDLVKTVSGSGYRLELEALQRLAD